MSNAAIPMDLEQTLYKYAISIDQIRQIMSRHETEFQIGLSNDSPNSTVAMLPSFLPSLPDGSEHGKFLGMDLGGTNLRVLCLEVNPGIPLKMTSRNYEVTQEAMTGTGEQLFDFVVDKMEQFLEENELKEQQLSLGFVFSFPCHQTSLRHAVLLWWTKGYTCTDTIGHDVVVMLQDAINRKNLKVKVQAIMNDTVGTLVACAYEHGPLCKVGIVLSTGCNAAYVEKTSNIPKFDPKSLQYSFPEMIIDTEWEEFGNTGQLDLIKTDIDREIDELSVHVGKQTQDKYVAGLHLGEHVRKLLLECLDIGFLPKSKDQLSQIFSEEYSFKTSYISHILSASKDSCDFLFQLGYVEKGETKLFYTLKQICNIVSKRSAGVLAAAIASLLKEMNWPNDIKIGFGGSLYKHHPTYKALLSDWLKLLVPDTVKWELVYTEDSAGKGACLAAAIAEKLGI